MTVVGNRMVRFRVVATLLLALVVSAVWHTGAYADVVQIVYTSDQHYGISRKAFRGRKQVPATEVNAALVASINKLPGLVLPPDGGVMAGKPVEWIDYVISTGDIANRMEGSREKAPMTATECWNVFMEQYGKGLAVKDRKGQPAELLAVPGNHDMTNAVGFFRPMYPRRTTAHSAPCWKDPRVKRCPPPLIPMRSLWCSAGKRADCIFFSWAYGRTPPAVPGWKRN